MSLTRTAVLFAALALLPAAFGADKNANAIIRLLNSRAAGSIASYAEAARIVAADAKKGRPLQQFVIGLVAEDPLLPADLRISAEERKRFLDLSRDKIRLLAESRGNALAWYLLSLENNNMTYLKRAADGNNVQALNALGTIRLTSAVADGDLDHDKAAALVAEGFGCFRKAAETGDANGFYNLGMCYMNGYGCEPDRERAFDCFRKAAESGHPQAINNIGGFYRDGIVVEPNLEIAAKWFARSAQMGDPYGKFNHAMAMLRGEGMEKNVEAGIEALKEAAAAGSAEAMCAYGQCLYSGEGVRKDQRAAMMWYRRSAALGYAQAMDNISVCYSLGAGVDEDSSLSAVWKIRARAARGDRNAVAWLIQNGHKLVEPCGF